MSDQFALDVISDLILSDLGEDGMATRVLKSYQKTIQHGGGVISPPDPVTYTDTIFQVPPGKTWLVIKMLWWLTKMDKVPTLLQIEKASSEGVIHMRYWDAPPT